ITLDGMCRPGEYPADSKVTLEPERFTSMHLLAARDALYLCTNILMGGHGLPGAVTLYLSRDGQGGSAPGPADLRLHLLPDGTLEAGTGDGSGYGGPAPRLITSTVISDTRFALQEDIRTVNTPWWAAEIRIPWEALAPYTPGEPLRFALSYHGTVAGGALAGHPQPLTLNGSWPAAFDPLRPDTWGEATTQPIPQIIFLPLVSQTTASIASSRAPAGSTSPPDNLIIITPDKTRANRPATIAGDPRPAPSKEEFDDACPNWTGNIWIKPRYAFDKDLKWPYVDSNFQVVQAEGKLTDMEISVEDSPFIHNSHDLDMRMSLAPGYHWLSLITENDHTISGGSELVLETESLYLSGRAYPTPGDHVTVKGRWIFDCGHDPKTEIHPIPIFETDRVETIPDGLGPTQHRATVRVARVWMTTDPHPFQYSLGDLGPFTFNLDYPPTSTTGGNDLLFLRVVQGTYQDVSVTGYTPTGIQVTIDPPYHYAYRYYELVLGYLDPVNPLPATGLRHVQLNSIEILDDHDSGWPDCWGVHDCGEWSMLIGVNGDWRRIWEGKVVYDNDPPYNLSKFSYPVVGGGDLSLRVVGYENDDPFKGDAITQGGWTISGACCGQRSFQPGGDWKLNYTVADGYGDGLTALKPANDSYWAARLADEPNGSPLRSYDLGELTVKNDGLTHIRLHDSYITQQPYRHDGTFLLSKDVDHYRFSLEDFGSVTFAPLPPGFHLTVDETYPWEFAGSLPPDLAALIGYKSARFHIEADTPAVAEQPYSLQIETKWRTLPPDWGEDQEQGLMVHGGRLVDLKTPDAAAIVTPEQHYKHPESRYLQKDWAWQHVVGDADYYDVWMPPAKTRPPGQPVCEYDHEAELRVTAYGMHLRAGTSYLPGDAVAEADDVVEVSNLNAQFPDGHIYVRVVNPTDHRGFYRLEAEWSDGQFYNPDECAFLHSIKSGWLKVMGHPALNLQSVFVPQIDLVNPPPFSSQLSLFGLGAFQPAAIPQAGAQRSDTTTLAATGAFDVLVSSAADQPVTARLLDADGVLVAEGISQNAAANNVRVLDGQVPRSRLTVPDLQAGETYFIQVVPDFDVGPAGSQQVPVGFTQQGAGE
ncbi:MAG: hypothetical protein D6775_12960, partial [Caldilineae bacterium]